MLLLLLGLLVGGSDALGRRQGRLRRPLLLSAPGPHMREQIERGFRHRLGR
jgi:hypothetical protein